MEHVWVVTWYDEVVGVFATRQAAKDAFAARWERYHDESEPYDEAIMIEDADHTWLLFSSWKPRFDFYITCWPVGWLEKMELPKLTEVKVA